MSIANVAYLIGILCFVSYLFIKHRHKYWARIKIPFLMPKHLIMGNAADIFLNKVPMAKYHAKIYDELAPHKFGGYFNFFVPMLLIRDPELIKNILTKDFHHFMNRGLGLVDEKEALSLHLVNLPGERWRILRTKLTPTFTSGKIKIMFGLMKECAQELTVVMDKAIENGEALEVKDIMARFTTDVISSCAFGLQSNSLKNPESIFRVMGKRVFAPNFRTRLAGFFNSVIPGLKSFFRLTFFEKEVSKFFEKLVLDTVKYREESNIRRNDFIDLLIALRDEMKSSNDVVIVQGKRFELTDSLMIAQCFVFFAAGFETSSGTLTFALYELAKNKEIQDRLIDEINLIVGKNDQELTYECLLKMTYLDQIVSETLRLYPIVPFLSRRCNENYQLNDDVTVEKGTRVVIPVLGLHVDPQYYEYPNEFNPENFTSEAKARRHHYTYLPFGEGPRICIGMRFGLTQVKLGLALLIMNYEVSLSSKMEGPLQLGRKLFLTTTEGGVWLTFKKRVR